MAEMIKTSTKVCSKCQYHMPFGNVVACDYYYLTKQHRGCPVGYCDKFLGMTTAEAKEVQKAKKKHYRDLMQIRKHKKEDYVMLIDHNTWEVKRKNYKNKR